MSDARFEHVFKVYTPGDAPAVSDFTLDVADGEFLVLVGPSGCGKSTTLRMLAGLETPTSGRLYIGGKDVTQLPPKDRDIAMVFQNYALYPHMNVRENMAFALKLRRFSKDEIERRITSTAHALGLEPYLKRLPKALSGGQRQRVALARAIVREPAVFLFDEPLSNLDAKMRVEMRSEIIRLHNSLGATMIYVTHDQTEAMTMGDRIVVMKDGCIQQVAPPLELYERPVNEFVASFIGTPPMNIFPKGTLEADCVFGIRPEHIRIKEGEASQAGEGELEAKIDFLEPLGPETLVHLKCFGGTVLAVARIPGFASFAPGAKVALSLDRSKAVRF